MSNELIMRDYLFRFLRSPDYKTDVNFYLPKYLAKDPNFAETQRVFEGAPDKLDNINDGKFFLHADFPIVENIPYGSRYKIPKYNGDVRAGDSLRYDGSKIFDGMVFEADDRFGEFCKWWFKATGYSIFDKEYRHNGIIRYDGLRPQEIEYDDDMDELSVIELEHVIEENISSANFYDGSCVFNGSAIADEEDIPTDNGGKVSISRSKRFNGKAHYDGDDINFFNGAIKADGKFSFESKGNQAKIEVIAVDVDGKFSSTRSDKNIPPCYVETFDLLPVTGEDVDITARTSFDDSVAMSDGGGELIIRRRSRYDGILSYRGHFEHAIRRFNGKLNYNNVYRVKADGADKYNGVERYGGRKNQNFVEYVSDLDGNIKIVDTGSLERLPIATRDKLGFVIAGYNLDIDAAGKISLPRNLMTQSESLERFVTTAEQLLAALPILASAPNDGETSSSMINMNEVVGYGDTSDPTISHLAEIVSYEPVYQIKTNDYIIGGANGIANLQARALVGRDNYLRKMINDLADKFAEIEALPGDDESRYSEILQRLNSSDVSIFQRQISQLERQNMMNALTMKSADMDVDTKGMILEVFLSTVSSAIDRTNAEVVSVISGDDSVDIADAKNLIKGGIYQLTDGETSEEVQIKENLGVIENGYRILFVNDVVNSYKNGRARLYRSSSQIDNGKAYGGGETAISNS